MDHPAKRLKQNIIGSLIGLAAVMAVVSVLFGSQALAAGGGAGGTHTTGATVMNPAMEQIRVDGMKFGLIAAAVAFGLGAIGAGLAIAYVGSAAMGAVAEKPQIAGQALIFVALAEGIVVFGFITALMILGKV